MNNEHKYDDIIHLKHHVSKVHKQMSLENRSAQFAPFAALTGYEDEVKETERTTVEKIEIDQEWKAILDKKIQLVQSKIKEQPEIEITYFIPDNKKQGGKYQKVVGNIKQIDNYNKYIILTNNIRISIDEIIDISGKIL